MSRAKMRQRRSSRRAMPSALAAALTVAAGLAPISGPARAEPPACELSTAAEVESALREGFRQVGVHVDAKDGEPALAAATALGELLERCRDRAMDEGHGAVLHLVEAYGAVAKLVPAEEAEALRRRGAVLAETITGPESLQTALGLSDLAETLSALGRAGEAEPLHRRALAIRESLYGPEHPDVAQSLNNLADTLVALGRFGEAEPLHRRALAMVEELHGPEHPLVATSLNNLAMVLWDLRKPDEAEPLLRRALAMAARVHDPEHPLVATILNNLAGVLSDLRQPGEAEPLLRRALAIREKPHGPESLEVAQSLTSLAETVRALGRAGEAEPLHRRALAMVEKLHGPEHPLVATIVNNLAATLQSLDRADEAEPLYRRALAIREKLHGPDHPEVARTLNNLATALSDLGRFDEAEPLHRRALMIREKVYGPEHPSVVLSLHNLVSSLRALGRDAEAEPLLRRALAILEKADPSSGENRRLAMLLMDGFVELAVYGSGSRADHTDGALRALQLSAQAPAGAALARTSARAVIRDPKAADDARRLEEARRERNALYRALDSAYARNDSVGMAALRDRLPSMENQIRNLEAQLRAEAPRYAELAAPKPLGLQDAAALLGSDEALLVFALDKPFSALLVITRERFMPIRLPDEARIRDLVTAVLGHMGAGRAARGGDPDDQTQPDRIGGPAKGFDLAAAYELYGVLLRPAEALIADKPHLIVVPQGSLTGLPFQLLVTRAPRAGTSYRNAAWLIRDHAVSVLPSVASLRALRQTAESRAGTAPLPFIGFGDPLIGDLRAQPACAEAEMQVAMVPTARAGVSTAAAPVSEVTQDGIAIADVSWLRAQRRLPDTRCELEALARARGEGSAIYLGPNATETKVKALSASGDLARYRVVAFATHGLLPKEAHGTSEAGLILTPPEQGSVEDDGLLTSSEVAGLKLNADWVILSACNTAGGEAPGSEALSGLARAFFFAGARSVLVSHWPIDSRTAVLVTTRALTAFKSDIMGKAEALRRAELSFLDSDTPDRFTDPRFWAFFSLIGDGELSARELLGDILNGLPGSP